MILVHVGSKIPPLSGKHNRTSYDTPHKNNIFKFADEFLIKLKHHLNYNLSDVPNFSRVCLLVLNKNDLKNIAVLLQDNINKTLTIPYIASVIPWPLIKLHKK